MRMMDAKSHCASQAAYRKQLNEIGLFNPDSGNACSAESCMIAPCRMPGKNQAFLRSACSTRILETLVQPSLA
ncbi:MAG: hypothetical protein ACI8T1_004485 [Verrucomicrobiales bacterium]|jgi:hypothetical protein